MSAPKGNEFWKLRSTHGREKIFDSPKLLLQECESYFSWCENNPIKEEVIFHAQGVVTKDSINKIRAFTLKGLCAFLGVNSKYFNDFEDSIKNKNPKDLSQDDKDFSEVITHVREVIDNQKFTYAAVNMLNANIIARDLGITDKTDITTNGKDLPSSQPTIVMNYVPPIEE